MADDELEPIEPVDPADMALSSPEGDGVGAVPEEPEFVEPIEPIEPIEPMEPVEPVEPIEPIEPIEPMDVSEEPMAVMDPDLEPLPEEFAEQAPESAEPASEEGLPAEPSPEGEEPDAGGEGGGGGGLLKSGRGRTIAVVILALAILGALVICVLVVSVVLPMFMGAKQEPGKAPAPIKAVQGKGKAEGAKPATQEAPEEVVESFEVYEYKDPFRPLVVDELTTTRPVGSVSTSSDTFTGSGGLGMAPGGADNPSSLALRDIYEKGGKTYVLVSYSGKSYTVAQGERIGKSPYQVLAVSKDSATMLFGDDRLNVYLGQVVVK